MGSVMNVKWRTWSLWLVVLLLPGGLLALPFLLARLRQTTKRDDVTVAAPPTAVHARAAYPALIAAPDAATQESCA